MLNERSWILSDRQLCDCQMILDGSFYPLKQFMTKLDYDQVLENMRLGNGKLFPMPVVLDVNEDFSQNLSVNDKITLRNKEGFIIAEMLIESIWKPDLEKEAKLIYGTKDLSHPAVRFLMQSSNHIYLGGSIKKINMPNYYDYEKYRLSPNRLKNIFKKMGWKKIIAFQTRNPMHRAHVEMTLRAMKDVDAKLLIHPVVGLTKAGDIDYYTRIKCYEHVLKKYPDDQVLLSLLPFAMRMGGPREALLHAIIRKNYGCTHFIIGRDHAGPGLNSKGHLFYQPYEAQYLVKKYEDEIGIKVIPFQFMVYVPEEKKYKALESLDSKVKYETISGTELREKIDNGDDIPKWFSYPEVSNELIKSRSPISKKGLTVFFTGLSGSGKSTVANGLLAKLLEKFNRPITLLDGDVVRTHLSSELGFSKEHRSLNVRRIGFVASEITKHGGIAICAPIAPYIDDRKFNRDLISKYGGYIEVYVSTSLEKCEERDSKGLYELARAGKVEKFTGISDPYEVPKNAEIVINSDGSKTPKVLVNTILNKIFEMGYLKA